MEATNIRDWSQRLRRRPFRNIRRVGTRSMATRLYSCERLNGLFNAHSRRNRRRRRPFYTRDTARQTLCRYWTLVCPFARSIPEISCVRGSATAQLPPFRSLPRFLPFPRNRGPAWWCYVNALSFSIQARSLDPIRRLFVTYWQVGDNIVPPFLRRKSASKINRNGIQMASSSVEEFWNKRVINITFGYITFNINRERKFLSLLQQWEVWRNFKYLFTWISISYCYELSRE